MTVPENVSTRRFGWPADYYSAPVRSPILPKWAPFGCGGLSLAVLLLVFAGGAFFSSSGFADLMDFVIGMSASEMKGHYAADVPAAQRKALDDEVVLLRKNLREEKVSMVHLQPFLERLGEASSDQKITVEEVALLQDIARTINAKAKH